METKIVDIAQYRTDPPKVVSAGFRASPLRAAGWIMSASSAGFALYVAYRAADFAVFDEVVAATLAVNAAFIALGASMVRLRSRAGGQLRLAGHTEGAVADDAFEEEGRPTSIEAFRKQRSESAALVLKCEDCGSTYIGSQELCPACGRLSRTA